MLNAPDSAQIDDALVAVLVNDLVLRAICPDGVWWDSAGEAGGVPARRYVIVSLLTHVDEPTFGGRATSATEDYTYLVKAVMLNASSVDSRAAAQRFDELLDDETLTLPDYTFGAMFREQRIRYVEEDAENPAIRWLHRGAHYRVQVALPGDVSHARGTLPGHTRGSNDYGDQNGAVRERHVRRLGRDAGRDHLDQHVESVV